MKKLLNYAFYALILFLAVANLYIGLTTESSTWIINLVVAAYSSYMLTTWIQEDLT
jgi:hypothetical protein